MKKKYYEPEFEMTLFSFERIAFDSHPEDKINVYDGDNPNDPNDPDPEFP